MRDTYGIVGFDEGIVDSNNLEVVVLDAEASVNIWLVQSVEGPYALRKTIRPILPNPDQISRDVLLDLSFLQFTYR